MWQRHTSGRGQSSAPPRCRQGAWGRWKWTPQKGLIVNSTDLCAGTHRAKADLTGQNGRAYDIKPAVGATCPKQHKGHKPSPKPSERKH